MKSADSQLKRLYLQRVVTSVVPAECDLGFIQSIVGDLLQSSGQSTQRPLNTILGEFKAYFDQENNSHQWTDFRRTIQLLVNCTLAETVSNYLANLAKLVPPIQGHNKTLNWVQSGENESPVTALSLNSSNVSSKQDLRTMADIAKSYTVPDDSQLFQALLLALVGQETGFFLILDDLTALSIPITVSSGSTALLTEILEAALLFRDLALHLESAKGKTNSPIKAAYLRFTETYLLLYASSVDHLFQSSPSSLLFVLHEVKPYIKNLRLLRYLRTFFQEPSGFGLLSKSFELSQFGDSEIAQFSTLLFNEVVKPYYQFIEHWIIKGELIDDDNEFFVHFDKVETHINDIIKFNSKLLPKFLSFEEGVFEKILQIGKTIVFLEKYCQELAWVNNYSSRYYTFIFKVHSGMNSMSTNTIEKMIACQFGELTNYFTAVVQSKLSLFLHLSNLKLLMFSEAGDFIDTINHQGHKMFAEPAMYLTPSRLSDLLNSAVSASSMGNLPLRYVNRIDARILDLSHGTVGWDVFTLEYKIPEIPLEALLNYQNQLTEYLRLFNFLWGLRHFSFLLQQNFILSQRLQKHELRIIKEKSKSMRERFNNFSRAQSEWIIRSARNINIVRHKILHVVMALLRFVSFDLIEKNFNEEIVKKLFRLKSPIPQNTMKLAGQSQNLSILNDNFLREIGFANPTEDCETIPRIEHNMNDCTLDDVVVCHKQYLLTITSNKLLREGMRGRASGESLVDQVYGFLEISFSFVQACDQFESLLAHLTGLLKMQTENEEAIEDINKRLEDVVSIIFLDVYKKRFVPKLDAFRRDLRAEPDLKDLSKCL